MTEVEQAILAMQLETFRCISKEEAEGGRRAARVYVGGMLLGCIDYIKTTYGPREAYKLISEAADAIIESQLQKGR